MTKAINHKLEFAKKDKGKREKIIEKRKTEGMVAKYWKTKGKISLFSKKEKNYESNIKDKINLDKANDRYPLLVWEIMGKKL